MWSVIIINDYVFLKSIFTEKIKLIAHPLNNLIIGTLDFIPSHSVEGYFGPDSYRDPKVTKGLDNLKVANSGDLQMYFVVLSLLNCSKVERLFIAVFSWFSANY